MTKWPEYMLKCARSTPPEGCGVVAGSTPVLFFGNPEVGVATISINPSYLEFLDSNGALLSGSDRRLATLQSLVVQRYQDIDDRLASEIVNACAAYFEQNPYMRWFRPLNRILQKGIGVSYCDGTACHLDLAQWATSPVWKRLTKSIQRRLRNNGRPFLTKQLHHGPYRLILANGKTAREEIEKARLVEWMPVLHPEDPEAIKFHRGKHGKTRFLAWSCYVQRSPQHIDALIRFVKRESEGALEEEE